MTRTLFLCLICVVLWVGQTIAQPFNTAKLDSLFTLLEQNNKAMCSIELQKNGKSVYSKSIGYVDLEKQQRANSTTQYRIGSVSKMFTAVMIFQLIEAGKLKLDDKLSKFYPQLPNADLITIAHLLQHRSGLHNFTADDAYPDYMTQPQTQSYMLSVIQKGGTDFPPDSIGDYSNTNFVLLGYIIEKVSKKNYQQVLKDKIIQPLQLKNTFYGSKINTKNNEAQSYAFTEQWELMPETDMSIPHGAGSIVSTSKDLCHFIQALFAGQLVKSISLQHMQTLKDEIGMGMFQFPFGNKKAYGHNGSIDGFRSALAYFPDDAITLALCVNAKAYPTNDILIKVLSAYYNKPYELPDFKSVLLKESDIEKYKGEYSSSNFPLRIKIFNTKDKLFAQATDQEPFPLEAVSATSFKFEAASISIQFKSNNEFTFKQGGAEFTFTKQ